jgi:hypothetical protein
MEAFHTHYFLNRVMNLGEVCFFNGTYSQKLFGIKFIELITDTFISYVLVNDVYCFW